LTYTAIHRYVLYFQIIIFIEVDFSWFYVRNALLNWFVWLLLVSASIISRDNLNYVTSDVKLLKAGFDITYYLQVASLNFFLPYYYNTCYIPYTEILSILVRV